MKESFILPNFHYLMYIYYNISISTAAVLIPFTHTKIRSILLLLIRKFSLNPWLKFTSFSSLPGAANFFFAPPLFETHFEQIENPGLMHNPLSSRTIRSRNYWTSVCQDGKRMLHLPCNEETCFGNGTLILIDHELHASLGLNWIIGQKYERKLINSILSHWVNTFLFQDDDCVDEANS